jgi:hypothetical protein
MNRTALAQKAAPAAFKKVAGKGFAEFVDVYRTDKVADGFGGDKLTNERSVNYEPIPVVRTPHRREVRTQNGTIWSSDKFSMPLVWAEELEIRVTDKLKRLEGGVAVPEKDFHIVEIKQAGVLYEIFVASEQE